MDGLFPLLAVAHDDGPALLVVGRNAHLEDVVSRLDAQLLVNFELHGEAVAVPSEPPDHMVASGGCVTSDNVLMSEKKGGGVR